MFIMQAAKTSRRISRFSSFVLIAIMAMGFCHSVFAIPEYPVIQPEKNWCCFGPEFGVFDLSGSYKGVIANNPTPGFFPGPEFYYQDEGHGRHSFVTLELVDQEVTDVLVTGGQQVFQTYTGTMVKTWYDSPNISPAACLPSPQPNFDMCGTIQQVANYDLALTARWCLSQDGFYFRGFTSIEITLTFTDSVRSIRKKMISNSPEDDSCDGKPVGISSVAYDYQDHFIFESGVGYQLGFGFPWSFIWDVEEFTDAPLDDCWCQNEGYGQPGFSYLKKIGPVDFTGLRGDIRLMVGSDLPLDLVESPFKPEGQFNLLKQSGHVRERLPLETDIEWNSYLDSIKDIFSFADATPTFDGTEYRFSGLPVFDVIQVGGRNVVKPARYSFRLRGLNVEENVTGSNPPATQFTLFSGADDFNVQVGELAVLTVTPLDAIPIKKNLINELSLLSPNNYLAPENLALAHVNTLEAGSPTDAQLEGLKRAILAERVARDGGRLGEEQIKTMLSGLQTVMSSLISDLFSKIGTGKTLKEKKKIKSSLEGELDASALANDGWSALPEDAEVIKSSISDLVDANFDLKLSLVAEKIKKWAGLALKLLNETLLSAGLDPDKTELAITAISDVINTVLDVMISQGLGSLEVAAQEAVKFAIGSAQDDLFDILPGSYTDETLEVVVFSQQKLESWHLENAPNEVAFRQDRRLVEQELVQVGIDAYANIGAANYYSILASGFSDASGILDLGSAFPAVKFAQLLAKLGGYLSGSASFIIPLRGAYWTTPATVREGVAKAYGEKSDDVFPLQASTFGASIDASMGALPNGMGADIVEPLRTTLNQIRNRIGSSFGQLSQEWSTDSIDDVLDILTGTDADDFPALFARFDQQLANVLAQGAGFDGSAASAIQAQRAFVNASIGFEKRLAEMRGEQLDLLLRILTREFTGPDDSRYEARKAAMLQNLQRLSNAASGLRLAASEYQAFTNPYPFKSAVVLRDVLLTSNSTALGVVTQANEVFTVTASVRNLGLSAVSGVEVELSLPLAVPVTIQSAAIQTVGSGSLTAHDGVAGSGSDEAVVSWQVQYSGPIDDQVNSPLALETRSTTVDDPGLYGTGYTVLMVDPEVFDPDGDGMPTAWENANGLNAAIDDGEADADLDGVPNSEEFERDLKPQVADSDMDGLDDGDELAGVNGWVTDPNDNDTDNDGVLDGADGSPLDPTSSAATPGLDPVVAVSLNEVALNEETPQVDITISNAGAGTLIWVAASSDPALVMTGAAGNSVQSGSLLTIQLTAGLDVDAADGQQVEIIVQDAVGATADRQIVTVTIGEPPDKPEVVYEDGFESG